MTGTDETARADDRGVRGRRGIMAFDVPARMTVIVDEAPEPLPVELMAAVNARDGYTPTLVVTASGYEGHQPQFTRAALEGLERDLIDPRVVGVADWAVPEAWGAVETGCVIDYTHSTVDDTLMVTGRDYLAVAQGWAIQVTTTATPQSRFIMDALFDEALERLSVLRRPAGQDAVTVLPGRLPLSESATGQANRIDLGGWLERAAWTRPDGVSLLPFTLEALAAMDTAAPVLPEDVSLLQDLTGAGLLGPAGMTGDGLLLAHVLQSADAGLSVTLYRDGRQSAMTSAMLGEVTGVIWGPSLGQREYGHPGEASERRSGAAVIPTTELSATVCGWLGVGPAWTDDESPVLAPTSLVDSLVAGERVEVDAFDPETSLYLWHLSTWAGQRTLDDTFVVRAGRHGTFQVRADAAAPDAVVLWPTDSSWVARMIEDRVQAAYFDRPVTLDA
jgi:hypothetical protein